MMIRYPWIPWIFFGSLVGAGLPSGGIGFVVGIAALAPLGVLAILRVPGFWMGVAGVGIGFSVVSSWLLINPNAPADAVWPIVVGIVIAAAGMTMSRFRRRQQHTAGG